MKKHLSVLFALCLVVSLLVPMFTMAEEIDTSDPSATSSSDVAPSPSDNVAPSPSDSVAPSPSDSVVPSPSDSVAPSPSDSVAPSPSDSVAPSPSDSVAPSPSDSVAPSPSDSVAPSPSDSVAPSPAPSPSPVKKIVDGKTLYKTLMEIGTEDEAEKFLLSLSDEELAALSEYASNVVSEYKGVPETVTLTDAGPLISYVSDLEDSPRKEQIMPLMSARKMSISKNDDGVELSKTAIRNDDGSYTVQLESYTTGNVTTETKGVPADIVLVLDQSASMNESFLGSDSRQEAMKSAVNAFIKEVSDNASTNKVVHRIAIVTYSLNANILCGFKGNDSEHCKDYSYLQGKVNKLTAPILGSTDTEEGMEVAKKQLESVSNETGRNKVVVVFTDGVPTRTASSKFDTGKATRAIEHAYAIKNTLKATVYSIGIFGGANPDEYFGDRFAYKDHPAVVCSGDVDSIWGASMFVEDDSFVDIAAGNRFLNYLSSNFPSANAIGIERGWYNPGSHSSGTGYQIKAKLLPVYKNYYLSAADTDKLKAAFKSISTQIGSTNTLLGDSGAVRDTISKYFNTPTTPDDIEVSTVACLGKNTDGTYKWADTVTPLATKNVVTDANSKTISVSGFAYDEQFVTATPRTSGGFGSKLVITFKVTPRGGFWGGNQVPTNTIASGLYSGDDLVENFNVPTVDVPINANIIPLTAKNVNIYLGNSVVASDLYTPITAPTGDDAWKGDFIDFDGIKYAASFDAKPMQDVPAFAVKATVPPRLPGTVKAGTVSSDATISVFTPKITFKDSSIYLGKSADFTGNSVSETWMHGTTVAESSTVLRTAPKLTYTYSTAAGYLKADTPVDVKVEIDSANVTSNVTFVNGNSHAGNTADIEFTVRVTPCTLTVSKEGCVGTYGDNQTFILHITGTNLENCAYADEVNLTVVVKGSDEKQITGLPVGNYTITEDSGWSWRYSANTGTAKLDQDDSDGEVTVTNHLKDLGNLWLSGSNWVQKIYNKKAG